MARQNTESHPRRIFDLRRAVAAVSDRRILAVQSVGGQRPPLQSQSSVCASHRRAGWAGCGLVAVLLALVATQPLRLDAQTLYWDTGASTVLTGGTGSWSTVDACWVPSTTLTNNHTHQQWTDGYDAKIVLDANQNGTTITVNTVRANSLIEAQAHSVALIPGSGPLTLGAGGYAHYYYAAMGTAASLNIPIVLGADQTWKNYLGTTKNVTGVISGPGLLTLVGGNPINANLGWSLTNTSSSINGLTLYGPGGWGMGQGPVTIAAGMVTNGALTLGMPGGSAVNVANLTVKGSVSATTSTVSTLNVASPAQLYLNSSTTNILNVGTITRIGHATLELLQMPSGGIALTNQITVANGLTTNNGIVSPWITYTDGSNVWKPLSNSVSSGLVVAPLATQVTISTDAYHGVYLNANYALIGNSTAQVLVVNNKNIDLANHTLTLGDGTYGLLTELTGSITNSGVSGALDFGTAEGLIDVGSSGSSTIGVPILGTNSLVKFGPGALTLQSSTLYGGPIWINNGTLTLSPTVDLTLSNNIIGIGYFAKGGANVLTLTGSNAFSFNGGLVSGGTLCVSGGSCTTPLYNVDGTSPLYLAASTANNALMATATYFNQPNCTLIVTNGAQFWMPAPGFNAVTNCSILATGAGTVWNMLKNDGVAPYAGYSYTASIGLSGTSNRLTIANGAVVTNVSMFTSGHGGSTLPAGNWGSLIITNGGQFFAPGGPGYLLNAIAGPSGPCANNSVIVTGNGSVWNGIAGNIRIGDHSNSSMGPGTNVGNWVQVDAGGVLTNVGTLYVGLGNNAAYGAISNQLTIINNGSVFASTVTVGSGASNSANIAMVQNGGLLEAGSLIVGTPGNFITNNAGIFQFTSASPTITNNGSGSIAINNGTISFRSIATANVTNNWMGALAGITFSGSNTFRLNAASTTNLVKQTYTFDPGLGATNYARLEMINASTVYGGQVTNALTIGTALNSGGSMLCSNTTAHVNMAFTNNGTLTIENSTLAFTTNATFNGTLIIDSDNLASLNGVVLASNLTLGASSALIVTGHGTNTTLITYSSLSGSSTFGSITVPQGYLVGRPANGQVVMQMASGTRVFFR